MVCETCTNSIFRILTQCPKKCYFVVKKMHVHWKWYVFFVHFFPEHASFVLMFPVLTKAGVSADTTIMINESQLFHTSGALYNY